MTRRFAAVTTFNAALYELYASRMIQSFDAQWPAGVPLLAYVEELALPSQGDRVVVRDLAARCPDLVAFKARHADNPAAHGAVARPALSYRLDWRRPKFKVRRVQLGLGYRWQAVRFAHKVFAIIDAAESTDADVLFWLDADMFFFAPVEPQFLESLLPPGRYLGYLARPGKYTETGFVAFDLRHRATRSFLRQLGDLYRSDRLFAQREWHDAWLFDVVRRRLARRGVRGFDIAGGIGRHADHVLINSRLGSVMDHLKSETPKERGASDPADLLRSRNEPYWQRLRARGARANASGNGDTPA